MIAHIESHRFLPIATAVLLVAAAATLVAAHPHATADAPRVKATVKGTIESIQGEQWIVGGRTVLVTAHTEIEDRVAAGDYVKVDAYENADGAWVAKEIDAKRRPFRDGTRVKLKLRGALESMVGDTWTVAGKSFAVSPRTRVEHEVVIGDPVNVEAYEDHDGRLVATEVESRAHHDDDDRDDDDRDDVGDDDDRDDDGDDDD